MKHPKLVLTGAIVVVALGGLAAKRAFKDNKNEGPKVVAVTRGTLVDKALAVGTIEPRVEVGVKSTLAGVVRRQYAQVGDYVRRGAPLLEISPNPTPLELVELRRSIDLRQIALTNLEQELERQRELRNRDLISQAEFQTAGRRVAEARTELELARDRLALQEAGKLDSVGSRVESVVRAPIDGYVLDKSVEIGDQVTPLTPYQEGTVLMRMAGMRGPHLPRYGGRDRRGPPQGRHAGQHPDRRASHRGGDRTAGQDLAQGEEAGAGDGLPDRDQPHRGPGGDTPRGVLRQCGGDHRAPGQRAADAGAAHCPPERQHLRHPAGSTPARPRSADIRTGLSDAINIEVLEGLTEGELVLEKPPKRDHTDVLREFLADIQSQKLRTTLTVLGIAWGTVAVVVLLAFGVGLERQTKKRFHGLGDRIVILFGGRTTRAFAGFPDGRGIQLTEDDADAAAERSQRDRAALAGVHRAVRPGCTGASRRRTRPLPASSPCTATCGTSSRSPAGGSSTTRTWPTGGGWRCWVMSSRRSSSGDTSRWGSRSCVGDTPFTGDRRDEAQAAELVLPAARQGPDLHPGLHALVRCSGSGAS